MADPPVEIQDRDGNDSTFLFNVSDNMNTREADETVDSIYGFDSDQTFVVSLEEQAQFEITGTATGNRISTFANYSSDPLTALAEYAARLLAHVNGNQGTGWDLVNSYTNIDRPVVIERVDVIKRRSEKYQFEYSITFRGGEGMMPYSSLSPNTVSPSNTITLGTEDLTEVEEMMITKRQRLKVYTYVTAGTSLSVDDNEVEARSGAQRNFTIRGNKTGSESTRDSFDTQIRSYIGNDTPVTLSTHFPGVDYDVHVTSHESTREAGVTQLGQYNMRLVQGGGL